MVRELNGAELAGFIKERQAKQVRTLRQANRILPRLLVIKNTNASPVIDIYIRMKKAYGDDILIETLVESVSDDEMIEMIERYNGDESVQGIIVQLPVGDPAKTDQIVNSIDPAKDVDGLGKDAAFISATAEAINWLAAGYSIDLVSSKIAIVGNGRLVGAPLNRMWLDSGYDVSVFDETSDNLHERLVESDVIVACAGSPRLIKASDVKAGAIVIDAGTTSENGQIFGDVDESVRERDDISITPIRGGVGPLTISLLYDHLIQACQKLIK